MSDSYLKFDSKQILYERIISIEKIRTFSYCIEFKGDDKNEKIVFMVDALPFYTPEFIHEIRKKIVQNSSR